MDPALLLALVLFAALITSAYTDMAQGKIYNWCTYPAIAVGVASYGWAGGWSGLVWSLVGLAVGLGLFLLPYWFGLMGGGDVKLIGAVGALHGLDFVLRSAFLSAVVGAVFGLSILIWKGQLGGGLKNLGNAFLTPWKLKDEETVDDTRVPYGLAIAVGTFWAWFLTEGIF